MSGYLTGAPDITPPDYWPEVLPPMLSPTQINTLLSCPEQFRRVYLQGEYSRPSGALVIGSADSDAAEYNFRQKIESHEDLPVADVVDFAAESFSSRAALEDVDWESSTQGECLDTTVRVVEAYTKQTAPKVQPVLVEEWVTLELTGLPAVRARVDLTTAGTVVSRKTSRSAVKGPKPGWVNQSAIESAATGLPTEWHVTTKAKTPVVQTPEVVPELADPDSLRASVRAVRLVQTAAELAVLYLEKFGPDSEWPGNFSTFSPPCGFCAFSDSCLWLR